MRVELFILFILFFTSTPDGDWCQAYGWRGVEGTRSRRRATRHGAGNRIFSFFLLLIFSLGCSLKNTPLPGFLL